MNPPNCCGCCVDVDQWVVRASEHRFKANMRGQNGLVWRRWIWLWWRCSEIISRNTLRRDLKRCGRVWEFGIWNGHRVHDSSWLPFVCIVTRPSCSNSSTNRNSLSTRGSGQGISKRIHSTRVSPDKWWTLPNSLTEARILVSFTQVSLQQLSRVTVKFHGRLAGNAIFIVSRLYWCFGHKSTRHIVSM